MMSSNSNTFCLTDEEFQHLLLLCKPVDFLGFVTRYLEDEKSEISTTQAIHAIHSLPFLLTNSNEFKSAICTILLSFSSADRLAKAKKEVMLIMVHIFFSCLLFSYTTIITNTTVRLIRNSHI